jgi:hypothetical protein
MRRREEGGAWEKILKKIRDDAKIEFDEEKRHQRDTLRDAAFDERRLEVDVGR